MNQILHGDSLDVLKTLEADSVDVCVTDPPYGYSFMGKAWDKALPDIGIFRECLRVLKPGAFAFVMSAPRSDVCARMMLLLEDAGFEIGFTPIYWTYASGFPKAMNIGKMVDKREGLHVPVMVPTKPGNLTEMAGDVALGATGFTDVSERVSDAAKALDGSYGGFQPKPAVEVIIVAMKPLSEKTYVDQALKNGKGITWLDDCRVPSEKRFNAAATPRKGTFNCSFDADYKGQEVDGRFPANLLVENSVLDTISCICTPRGNTQTVDQDWNSEEGGTEVTIPSGSREARKQSVVSQKPYEGSGSLPNTAPLFPAPGTNSSTSEEGRNDVATTETATTTFGGKQSFSETDADASYAEPLERTIEEKDYTPTTSNRSQDTQNSASRSVTGVYCALHATGKRQPTESNQQYSRFFSLDAWAQTLPFLAVPKASKGEKNKGLEGFDEREAIDGAGGHGSLKCTKCGKQKVNVSGQCACPEPDFQQYQVRKKNHHPTVKPLKLMSYLITLGSRPGDVVLDPFMGSGTTCIAAKELGRDFIGIEREQEYVEIAEARLQAVNPTLV